MNPIIFEKWSELARKVQEPIQAMSDLNLKTLQNLSYLKPEDFLEIKKPEELFEKQIGIVIENGHKVLDLMGNSFQIVEKAMLSMVEDARTVIPKKGV